MIKRVLGFDPGLANTGWGVIDADTNRFKLVSYGSITTPSDAAQGERLDMIFQKSEEIIKKFSPLACGIESLYFTKNVTSAIPVAEARGVLLLSLYRSRVGVFEFTPQQIKLAITGSGRSEKTQIQEMLRILLGLKESPKPDHAADALGAAVCCYNNLLMNERGVV